MATSGIVAGLSNVTYNDYGSNDWNDTFDALTDVTPSIIPVEPASMPPFPYYDRPSELSYTQEVVLVFLPIIPAMLSIIGSSCLLYSLLRNNRFNPYKRLLFGLSACDILYSITLATQAFLVPRGTTSGKAFALGNRVTCNIAGTLYQFGQSNSSYYAMVSFHYLFIIRFKWKRRDFGKRIEPVQHLLAVGWPLCTAVASAAFNFNDELNFDNGCWIDNYPKGCADSCIGPNEPLGCYRGCRSGTIGWIFTGGWYLIILVSVLVNNVLILLHVRSTIQSSKRRKGDLNTMTSAQSKKLKNVAIQAFLYVGVLLLTNIWTLALSVLEAEGYTRASDGQRLYVVLLLQAALRPIAGFFNFLVYLRPQYVYCRFTFPNKTKWWCLLTAFHGMPPSSEKQSTNVTGHDEAELHQLDAHQHEHKHQQDSNFELQEEQKQDLSPSVLSTDIAVAALATNNIVENDVPVTISRRGQLLPQISQLTFSSDNAKNEYNTVYDEFYDVENLDDIP